MIDQFKNRDILCFSHDWSGAVLSKTHLMRLLSKRNRVLWVNSIGYRRPTATASDIRRIFSKLSAAAQPIAEVEPNLFVFNPLALPAYQSALAGLSNRWLGSQVRRAMRRLGFSRSINFVFNPAAATVAGTLGEEQIVYYCVDEYSALAGVDAGSLIRLEAQMLQKADLVVASSRRLYEAKKRANPNTILVRHGVDFDHFRAALDPQTPVPAEIAILPQPVIGYFGLISADWVDTSLLLHLAKTMPEASIVMLGKVAMDISELQRLPNVHFLGQKPYETLPNYCKGFDAAIVPFPINSATLSANPLKLREYLAAGLPVVSTDIPEARAVSECRIGADAESFVAEVRAALRQPGPNAARSETMRSENWAARLAEVETALASSGRREDELVRMAAQENIMTLLQIIREDFRRKALWCYEATDRRSMLKAFCTDGAAAMVLYRLMQWSGHRRLRILEMIFNKLNAVICKCIIGRGAEFGPGLVLIHSMGVVINGSVRGGSGIHIEHQVTIGAERRQSPAIGDDVFIGAGAKIIGNVKIGDGARIGANAVVIEDVPEGRTAVGVPARLVPVSSFERMAA